VATANTDNKSHFFVTVFAGFLLSSNFIMLSCTRIRANALQKNPAQKKYTAIEHCELVKSVNEIERNIKDLYILDSAIIPNWDLIKSPYKF
jgi:hypothetical protein